MHRDAHISFKLCKDAFIDSEWNESVFNSQLFLYAVLVFGASPFKIFHVIVTHFNTNMHLNCIQSLFIFHQSHMKFKSLTFVSREFARRCKIKLITTLNLKFNAFDLSFSLGCSQVNSYLKFSDSLKTCHTPVYNKRNLI